MNASNFFERDQFAARAVTLPDCRACLAGSRVWSLSTWAMRGRAAIIFVTVAVTFLVGLLMRGPLFHPGGADLLSRLIQFGGFIGDLASGLFYFLAVWLGYAQPDVAGHAPDYGSKFLVAAGLFNILAMVDAYEIATKQKD